VLQSGSPLPKLAVFLRGGGIEVLLNAKNGFQGIKILNTFESIPDVPQSYFELNIKGGSNGILNSFFDLCKKQKRGNLPGVDTTFTGHNGKVAKSSPRLQVKGCGATKKAKSKSKKKKKSRASVISHSLRPNTLRR
jgi:hypothetical protein